MNKKIIILIFLLSFLGVCGNAFADSGNKDELTLNDAIKKAFTQSKTLSSGQMEIDKTEKMFDRVSQYITSFPIDRDYNKSMESPYKSYYGLDYELKKSEKRLENDKRQLIIDTKSKYFNVLLAQYKVQASKLSLTKSLLELSNIHSKYEVGMATKLEVLSAESQVVKDKTGLKESESLLATAYNELNILIGLDSKAAPTLVDDITFLPVDFDKETEVLKAVNNSYETWNTEEAVRYSEQMKFFETYLDVGTYNEAIAKNSLRNTKEQISIQARTLCHTVENMKARYAQIEEQEKQLLENLRLLEVQQKVGMVTKDKVVVSELALEELRVAKKELVFNYFIAIDNLKKLTGELNVKIS